MFSHNFIFEAMRTNDEMHENVLNALPPQSQKAAKDSKLIFLIKNKRNTECVLSLF